MAYNTSFPSMMVSEKEKNDEWCNRVLEAVISYMTYGESPYESSRTKDIKN